MKLQDEPKFSFPLSKLDVVKTLNYYNQNVDYNTSLNWATDYIHKIKKIDVSNVINKDYVVYGFVCRMLSNNCLLSDDNMVWFNNKTNELINRTKKETNKIEKIKSEKIIIRKKDNTSIALNELDRMLDEMILSKFNKSINPICILDIKNINDGDILKFSESKIKEFKSTTTDEYLKEAYSNFSSGEIKKIINFFQKLIDTILIKKSNTQTRKKKSKNILKHFKYCKIYSDLNLTSIDPQKIIGNKIVWIYNVKYKKITKLVSKDDTGLSIYRSSIINYDENESKCKILKKPNIMIPKILEGGKIFLRDFFDTLKTKELKLTNRINEDYILLRTQ